MTWRSSVLNVNVDDDTCPICEFLSGSRRVEDLLAVIHVLDAELAAAEAAENQLLKKLIDHASSTEATSTEKTTADRQA